MGFLRGSGSLAAAGRMLLVLGGASLLVSNAAGYAIEVQPGESECFWEDVTSGHMAALEYEVAEGGNLDIDVLVLDPDKVHVYEGERETDGKIQFSIKKRGRYEYCFSNDMSTVTAKVVVFEFMKVGPSGEDEEGATHEKVLDLVHELSSAVSAVNSEQQFMNLRMQIHTIINDGTNSAVVWWGAFETLVLMTMSALQVYYINNFFEVRTNV